MCVLTIGSVQYTVCHRCVSASVVMSELRGDRYICKLWISTSEQYVGVCGSVDGLGY